MVGKDWRKVKCVRCGYEFATRSDKPMCSHCKGRRINDIDEFTVLKQTERTEMAKKKTDVETVESVAEEKVVEKPKLPAKEDDELWTEEASDDDGDDIDKDIWG